MVGGEMATMTPHEALMWLDAGTASRPRYICVEYSMIPGHFFVRSMTRKGMRVMATRDASQPKFDTRQVRDDADFLEWINDRTITKSTQELAQPSKGR
jgi:hypothetical protein